MIVDHYFSFNIPVFLRDYKLHLLFYKLKKLQEEAENKTMSLQVLSQELNGVHVDLTLFLFWLSWTITYRCI